MTEVSVVVATRDRAASLVRLLSALEAQTLPRGSFEIVVVDDGSVDRTAAVLREHGEGAAGPFVVLHQGSSRGPAVARNSGWRAARSPVIAFTDDDCRPEVNWLEAGLRSVAAGAAIVMGRTVADRDAPGYGEPFSRTMEVDHEDGRYPTCNVFYRRDVLEAVGGFDEGFRFACGEDTDLAWRARERGFSTAFDGDVMVEHEVRPPDFALFLRERRRFAEQVRLVARHPAFRAHVYRRWLYRRSHAHAIAAWALIAGAYWQPWVLLGVPIVWSHRFRGTEFGRARSRVVIAAQLLVADTWELVVFAIASVRHRALLL